MFRLRWQSLFDMLFNYHISVQVIQKGWQTKKVVESEGHKMWRVEHLNDLQNTNVVSQKIIHFKKMNWFIFHLLWTKICRISAEMQLLEAKKIENRTVPVTTFSSIFIISNGIKWNRTNHQFYQYYIPFLVWASSISMRSLLRITFCCWQIACQNSSSRRSPCLTDGRIRSKFWTRSAVLPVLRLKRSSLSVSQNNWKSFLPFHSHTVVQWT